jgi:glycosyl transferase family 2
MPDITVPRVACLMMQRDEDDLVRPWILYHAKLFGYSSLYIFDNGSSSLPLIQQLQEWERIGVNVYWEYSTPADFNHKGDILGQAIKRLAGQYDFFIPLDCDEFFVAGAEKEISCESAVIFEALADLLSQQAALRVTTAFYNILNHPDWYWRWPYKKTFFRDGTFSFMCHGYHEGRSLNNEVTETRFAYMHYFHKPYSLMVQHAKNKLRPFVDVEDRSALETYRGPNHHCKNVILESSAIYEGRFGHSSGVYLPAFGNVLRSVGADIPFRILEQTR